MLLGLMKDSYLRTGIVHQFAAEVLQVIAYTVTVPVAFTEGFLRAYLSIDRVEEDDNGRGVRPQPDATFEDMIRDRGQITAQVDPGAVFNPVVAPSSTPCGVEQGDEGGISTRSRLDDAQLMEVLRGRPHPSRRRRGRDDEATDYVRADRHDPP